MPHDEADPTDPMMLIGMELPADTSASVECCRVFAEEFARMGFDEGRVLQLFGDPFYAGPHRAFQELGEERVREIVREYVSVWGRVRFRECDLDPETGLPDLPVLGDSGGDGCGREGRDTERRSSHGDGA